ERSRRGERGVAPGRRGSRFPRGPASRTPSPLGGRARRIELPARRHGEVSEAPPTTGAVAFPNGEGGSTSQSWLVLLGSTEPSGNRRREPSQRCEESAQRPRPVD